MAKQIILVLLLGICLYSAKVLAKPPTDHTYVVPSPGQETPPPPTKEVDLQQQGLDPDQRISPQPKAPTYHLEPRPSVTFSLSRAYELSEEDHSGWFGFHAAPWMTATTRFQIGVDLHEDIGWIQVAAHSLPTRNLYRLYWGGGVSLILDSDRQLRPIVDLDSYHLFLAGGWEFQLLERQNARFEFSFHQGLQTAYGKALLGYTLQF
ncbi:hypothetical protein K2X05_06430 [bacterium]|nr:hypothetical protein [bacterium]